MVVDRGPITLAGSLWRTPEPPRSIVVMHPGSGPSDRHNDVYFPPIRAALLAHGHAVASFDKRGVGGSGGDWATSSIAEQAGDLIACAHTVATMVDHVPIGVFGHSQGGWVVYEALSHDTDIRFGIANSGPAVSPVEQERFSLRSRLPDDVRPDDADAAFDRFIAFAAADVPLAEVQAAVADDPASEPLRIFVTDEVIWANVRTVFGYEPADAFEGVTVPLLALFGGADDIVPVAASEAVLRERVPDDLLEVVVFDGADHRIQRSGRLAVGYLDRLTAWIDAQLDDRV